MVPAARYNERVETSRSAASPTASRQDLNSWQHPQMIGNH
jgi:hypothetical protein